ncbi:putative mitochondrial protein-like [Abeliophyllum distichum]|uniref:Mitochondrial protein-like n=1 Tax=Abeliophyllum distichum TaxID=126358 RepID=A0ABD1SYL1_9LAMI
MAKAFEVQTGASYLSLGRVLEQEMHSVAYESRKQNNAESCYSVHEKELLVVVYYLKVWRHYLLRSPFIVKTDNTAVSYFMLQSKLLSKERCYYNHKGLNTETSREGPYNTLFSRLHQVEKNSTVLDGWRSIEDKRNCLYVPKCRDLRKFLIPECHDML